MRHTFNFDQQYFFPFLKLILYRVKYSMSQFLKQKVLNSLYINCTYYWLYLFVNFTKFLEYKMYTIKYIPVLLTLVYVSKDTTKNPLPVKQQGIPDLIMTSIKSFFIILPLVVIGIIGQGPLFAAVATLKLSRMIQSQL